MRYSPDTIKIPSTIGIWDNKVAVISSKKEGFGFVIESQDYADSMHELYELLWAVSKTWNQLHAEDEKTQDENLKKQKPQKATEEDLYY